MNYDRYLIKVGICNIKIFHPIQFRLLLWPLIFGTISWQNGIISSNCWYTNSNASATYLSKKMSICSGICGYFSLSHDIDLKMAVSICFEEQKDENIFWKWNEMFPYLLIISKSWIWCTTHPYLEKASLYSWI